MPISNNDTTTYFMPELASLLEVADAVARADDQSLMGLVKASPKPEDVFRQIRQSAPFTSHPIQGVNYYEHSVLWLMPVITRTSYPSVACAQSNPASSQGPHIAAWLREWFGPENQLKCLDFIPSYDLLMAMTPGAVRGTLEALVNRLPNEGVQFNLLETQGSAPAILPDLAFIMGSISRLVTSPSIPQAGRSHDVRLWQRVSSAIGLWIDIPRPESAIVLGTPSVFGDAMLEGLLMWVRETALQHEGIEWTAHPVDSDIVGIEWIVRNPANHDTIQIVRHVRISQIGAEGLDQLLKTIASTCVHNGGVKKSVLLS